MRTDRGGRHELIATRGMRGTTTKAIAREEGISEGALYRHFKNRDEIVALAVDHLGAGMSRSFHRVEKSSEDPLERLEGLFLGQAAFVEEHRGIPRLAFSEEIHLHRPDLRSRMALHIESYLGCICGLVEEGKRAGRIRSDVNGDLVAVVFVGTMQALTLRWSLSGFHFSLSEKARSAWQDLRHLIAPSGSNPVGPVGE